MTGEYERAETFLQEALEVHREIGAEDMIAPSINLFGFLALSRNDLDRAEDLCVVALRELRERAQLPGIAFALDILAGVAASRGEIRRAARLWGAAAGSREVTGVPWLLEERAMIEPHIEAARSRLDELSWQGEWENGRVMSLDQAVSYALEASGERATEQG